MADPTDADVELVANVLDDRVETAMTWGELKDAARAVLAVLSGRLLPPGGETHTSWAVRDQRGAIRRWTETEARRVAAEHGGTLLCGTRTYWPDGTMLLGAWQPAPEEGTDG